MTSCLLIHRTQRCLVVSWKIDLATIPDDLDFAPTAPLGSAADARRKALDWGIIGAAAAAFVLLVAAGSWIQRARRPQLRRVTTQEARHYHGDTAGEHAPTERVRELVRRNPEVAASVLERWTTQREGLS